MSAVAAGKLPAITAPVCVEVHTDDEADSLADGWVDAEGDAFHAQYDAA